MLAKCETADRGFGHIGSSVTVILWFAPRRGTRKSQRAETISSPPVRRTSGARYFVNASEKKRFIRLFADLKTLSPRDQTNKRRRYYAVLREILHLFEDMVCRLNALGEDVAGTDGEALRELADRAVKELGGWAEPSRRSLKNYDHARYGPFLGVSDDGTAACVIRRAALNSPKMRVLGTRPSIVVGVAHDAERLAAGGEVVVGPDEYRNIILGCQGSILISTNIGTRLNLRYYKRRPLLRVASGSLQHVVKQARRDLKGLIEPFWLAPGGKPRPVTVLVHFTHGSSERRAKILRELRAFLAQGACCDPALHALALLVITGPAKRGVRVALKNIDLAHDVGIAEMALSGAVRRRAQDQISMPGLLNYFAPAHVNTILSYARAKNVRVVPKNLVDADTVARNVWAGLQTARSMGLELGKYGLFPLTMEESAEVMALVQRWFTDWTAAPVFYVDFPLSTRQQVFAEGDIVTGAKQWLDAVARHGIPVVLFDTADKAAGRRLLKDDPQDAVGILTLEEIRSLDHYAKRRGINCLWAGGITIGQALDLGKLEVFGVYVTSAVAIKRPVTKRYERDPMIVAEKEPTFEGVSRVKLLLEAGFLIGRLRGYGLRSDAEKLERCTEEFLKTVGEVRGFARRHDAWQKLESLTLDAWRKHFQQFGTDWSPGS